jgi:threonine dehydrogenase-like Zn-dependent dehydrogenase
VTVAPKFGATEALNTAEIDPVGAVADITDGRMADLVVEAVGEPETINLMPKLVRERGLLMSFGVPRGPHAFEFDYFSLYRQKCHLISEGGTIGEPGRRSPRMALQLIARGDIDVSPMITHHIPFGRVHSAYELARSREDGVIKIVIDMAE